MVGEAYLEGGQRNQKGSEKKKKGIKEEEEEFGQRKAFLRSSSYGFLPALFMRRKGGI